MAATLTVSYTPQYQGAHRICFRTTQTAYCCYLDQSLSIIGFPKTTEIDLTEFASCLVDPPAQLGCVASVLNGYVQPACEASDSLADRVTFSVTYPDPTPCAPYEVLCTESGIAEIEVTDTGLGWLPGQSPTITITDNSGYGSGATAEAVMACNDANICYVESITIVDVGQFYYFPNQISVDISLPTDPGGIPATAIITSVDDCGTFTIPDCDGTANPTTYQLWGGAQYAINLCAGGAGPEAFKYTVTPNPTYGGLGSELVVNGDFTTDLSGWTNDSTTSVIWSSNYGGSANFGASDSYSYITEDILTVGQTYTVNIDLAMFFNPARGCSPAEESFTQFNIYAGTAVYGPLNFSGTQSFTFDITCTDNPTFKIEAWDPNSCTYDETLLIAQMFCSYVSVKEVGAPIPVSCCDCVKYDVINTGLTGTPIEFYYTDCLTQVITTQSIGPQGTIQVCAVRNSIWPSEPDNNQSFEYILSGVQDC